MKIQKKISLIFFTEFIFVLISRHFISLSRYFRLSISFVNSIFNCFRHTWILKTKTNIQIFWKTNQNDTNSLTILLLTWLKKHPVVTIYLFTIAKLSSSSVSSFITVSATQTPDWKSIFRWSEDLSNYLNNLINYLNYCSN